MKQRVTSPATALTVHKAKKEDPWQPWLLPVVVAGTTVGALTVFFPVGLVSVLFIGIMGLILLSD